MRAGTAPAHRGLFLKTLHLRANFHIFKHLASTCLEIYVIMEREGGLSPPLKEPHTVQARDIQKVFFRSDKHTNNTGFAARQALHS